MGRSRSGRRSVNVWPALSDTILAFLLTIIILLAFVIANSIRIDGPNPPPPYKKDQEKVTKIVNKLAGKYGGIELNTFKGRQEIKLGNEVLFESGSAKLSKEGKRMIKDLVNQIAEADLETLNEIVVQGHTDKVPVKSGKFPTNWELSTARASRVVRALIQSEEGTQRINPNEVKFVASGYSKYQPMDPNDLSENRRIELRLTYASSNSEPAK